MFSRRAHLKKLLPLLCLTLAPLIADAAIARHEADITNGATFIVNNGSNSNFLEVYFFDGSTAADCVSSIDDSGNGLTRIEFNGSFGISHYLYYLANPPLATSTITVSGCAGFRVLSYAFFSGVDILNPIDTHANASTNAGTSLSISTTVSGANEWVIGGFAGDGATLSPQAGTFFVACYPPDNVRCLVDTSGTVPVGSQSLGVSWSGAQDVGGVIASINAQTTSTPTVFWTLPPANEWLGWIFDMSGKTWAKLPVIPFLGLSAGILVAALILHAIIRATKRGFKTFLK